ncbi:hypothetical protein TCAL_09498, partial [Tigriopus californicus]
MKSQLEITRNFLQCQRDLYISFCETLQSSVQVSTSKSKCPLNSYVSGFEFSKYVEVIRICARCNETVIHANCILSKVSDPPMISKTELIGCPSGQMAMKKVSACLIWQRKFCIDHHEHVGGSEHVDFEDEPYAPT